MHALLLRSLIFLLGMHLCAAFVTVGPRRHQQYDIRKTVPQVPPCRRTNDDYKIRVQEALKASNNLFDDIRAFFDFGGKKEEDDQGSEDEEDDDNLPAGEYRIMSIPVEQIKPGGLRLFLMFFLMGLQNTPEPKSWVANQPSTDDYVIDYWYKDQTAVLTITLEEHRIALTRVGSKPSTSYLMQESIVVQGILEELQTMAEDPSIERENRLVILQTPDAIERARDSLSFG